MELFSIPYKKSPCTGVCTIDEASGYCQGCVRSREDIARWRGAGNDEREELWRGLAGRRAQTAGCMVRDQLKRTMPLTSPVKRIVSLVPSLTATLYELGLADRVVGATGFCPAPEGSRRIARIGGTKNPDVDKILALDADLILANKEENPQEQVERMAAHVPVWVSDVATLDDSIMLIRLLGEHLDAYEPALATIKATFPALSACHGRAAGARAAYLIWKKPYMTVGGDTFIGAWLKHLGYENPWHEAERYPELSVEELRAAKLDVLLLASEPYRFRDKDREELAAALPGVELRPVDGAHFSWFGTPMRQAAEAFSAL